MSSYSPFFVLKNGESQTLLMSPGPA